jgi:hypothetical protein
MRWRWLVEDVVFGEEFFEFGFVNAADDAFGLFHVADGFGEADGGTDGEQEAHAHVAFHPGVGGHGDQTEGGGPDRGDEGDPGLGNPGITVDGGGVIKFLAHGGWFRLGLIWL